MATTEEVLLKARRMAPNGVLAFVILALALIGLLYAVNLGDESLDPRAEAVVKNLDLAASENEKKAYKLLLAFTVPAGDDIEVRGDEIHAALATHLADPSAKPGSLAIPRRDGLKIESRNRHCPSRGCSLETVEEVKEEIEAWITTNSEILRRLDRLLVLGGFRRDLFGSLDEDLRLTDVMNAVRVKQVQMQLAVVQGRAADAARDAQLLHSFLDRSLTGPKTLVETLILISLMGSNRRFVEETAAARAEFKSAITDAAKQTRGFTLSADPKSLLKRTFETEFVYSSELVRHPQAINVILDQSAVGSDDGETKPPWWRRPMGAALSGLFQPNRTANRLFQQTLVLTSDECLEGSDACAGVESDSSLKDWFINPVGASLSRVLASSLSTQAQKRYRQAQTLRQPVKI